MKNLHFLIMLLLLSLIACRQSGDLSKELVEAAKMGNVVKAESLLKQGADVNSREQNGQLALMGYNLLLWASSKGHFEMVKLLLSYGADVNSTDIQNRSPLIMAAAGGYMDIAVLLLESGADPCSYSKQKDTVLMAAAAGGHNELVLLFLGMGLDVNAANDLGKTALMSAALRGHTQTVASLLAGGAKIDLKDTMGNTALLLAAAGVLHKGGGSVDTVKLLLAYGADPTIANRNGDTPLSAAKSRGSLPVVELLLTPTVRLSPS